jgi:hypothetical protein
VQFTNIAQNVVVFLHALLDAGAGCLTIVGNDRPIHHAHVVKDFLWAGAAKRLYLDRCLAMALSTIPMKA